VAWPWRSWTRAVSAFLAWVIRSPCLRHCVHGASIGGSELSVLEGEHHFSPSQTALLVRAQALSVGRRCVLLGDRFD
jgi:hypothetical protein